MKTHLDRREFLKVSTAGAIGLSAVSPMVLSSCKTPDRKSYGVGLQVYTIRDAMKEDAAGSLQKISDMGFKYLELADYTDRKFYGFEPEDLKKRVNDLGMQVVSNHYKVEAEGISPENAKITAEDHARLGVEYCIQPWVEEEDRTLEKYRKMVSDWNEVGRIMKEAGIQFGYHNHNFEFREMDGVVPYYDIFLPNLDKELVIFELDLYWATKAGQDPVEIFNRYPGRFELFHVKDMKTMENPYYDTEKKDMTSVGEGLIDFKRIFAAKEVAGMKYFFVEDDTQGNGKPFEALEISIDNLTSDILVS